MKTCAVETIDLKRTNTLFVFMYEGKKALFRKTGNAQLDRTVRGLRSTLGESWMRECALSGGPGAARVMVVDRENIKGYDAHDGLCIVLKRALSWCSEQMIADMVLVSDGAARVIEAACEAEISGTYTFNAYKKHNAQRAHSVRLFLAVPRALQREMKGRIRVRSMLYRNISMVRDLVNEPGGTATPAYIVSHIRRLFARSGVSVAVLTRPQLEKKGYNGLLTVGRGAQTPPAMVIMRYGKQYRSRSANRVALVGKGVTFDSGGISLKPGKDMWEMKGDMAGAAAVIGMMKSVHDLKLKRSVTGIVALAENMIGSRAVKPGDIFRAHNGKTVMVDNTDAEGRLILTDALAAAGAEKATHIIDFATLTGSCVAALGSSMSGVFGNDPALVKAVLTAGERVGEHSWELPLFREYREKLNTPYADINNIGDRYGGAITAALFLQEFVPENTKWVHMDIAGPFLVQKKWKHFNEGATGVPVKTVVAMLEQGLV